MLDELVKTIEQDIVQNLRTNFTLQGHKLTGTLNSSIVAMSKITDTGALIQVIAEEYAEFVNNGVAASRIPFGKSTGAKTSKYIQALAQYAKLRFLADDKSALSIAFAIAKKHKKEGMPTRGSFVFSSNGRRVGAIDDAIEETLKNIESQLASNIEVEIQKLI